MTSTIEGRLVHQHTHEAYLLQSPQSHSSSSSSNSNSTETADYTQTTLMATTTGLRYSLMQGKQGMTAAMQKASRSSVALAMRRNSSSSNSKSGTTKRTSQIDPTAASSPPASPKSPSSSSTGTGTGTSPTTTASPTATTSPATAAVEMTKIFVLLLEPKTKTFELIQLVYPSATTTIGDILRMIPLHATELALGSQKYVGLCRPKEEQELSDLTLLASTSGTTTATTTANVCPGEILVAIPQDYSVAEVSKFSQAILTNRRFTKLMRRNNPLAPKMRKHSDRKHKDRKHSSSKRHSSGHHGSKHHRSVHILEKHDEEGDDDQMMQRALEKAASAAAQANANIPTSPQVSPHKSPSSHSSHNNSINNNGDSMPKTTGGRPRKSLAEHFGHSDDDSSYAHSYASSSWVDGGGSIYSESTTATGADSLGDSISSWSKSLDKSFSRSGGRPQYARHRSSGAASIASSNNHGVSQSNDNGMTMIRARRPNDKRKGSLFWTGVASVLLLAYLTASYLMDPHRHDGQDPSHNRLENSPMGLPGLLQVVFLLAVLKKVQFLFNRRQRKMQGTLVSKPPHQSACPAVRLYAKYWNKNKSS